MSDKVEYRLSFSRQINDETSLYLMTRIANILEKDNVGSLIIQFASEGGSTDQSIALYNYLKTLPIPIHIHAIGHVGSTGIPVFLAGHKRTCAPLSRFFLHGYDWEFIERRTPSQIDEAVQRLRSDIELAREIIKSNTMIDAGLLKVMDGESNTPIIMNPTEAKECGIVEDILDLPQTGADGMQVAVWT